MWVRGVLLHVCIASHGRSVSAISCVGIQAPDTAHSTESSPLRTHTGTKQAHTNTDTFPFTPSHQGERPFRGREHPGSSLWGKQIFAVSKHDTSSMEMTT